MIFLVGRRGRQWQNERALLVTKTFGLCTRWDKIEMSSSANTLCLVRFQKYFGVWAKFQFPLSPEGCMQLTPQHIFINWAKSAKLGKRWGKDKRTKREKMKTQMQKDNDKKYSSNRVWEKSVVFDSSTTDCGQNPQILSGWRVVLKITSFEWPLISFELFSSFYCLKYF